MEADGRVGPPASPPIPAAAFERDRTDNGDRSYPIRRAGARRAARGAAPRIGRRRRARPAGRTSFLHHLPVHRRGREIVAAAAGAISGRDDGHSPAPVLGSGGDRGSLRGRPVVRRHSGAPGGSLQCDQELLRSVGAVRPAIRTVRCRGGSAGEQSSGGAAPAAGLPVPAPATESQDEPAKPSEGAEVVRLDRFRKK